MSLVLTVFFLLNFITGCKRKDGGGSKKEKRKDGKKRRRSSAESDGKAAAKRERSSSSSSSRDSGGAGQPAGGKIAEPSNSKTTAGDFISPGRLDLQAGLRPTTGAQKFYFYF